MTIEQKMLVMLESIRDELQGIREAMELKEVDADKLIEAINKKTKDTGKCPLVL